MRISDWSSDVCSSDLGLALAAGDGGIDQIDIGEAVGEFERSLETVRQPRREIGADDEAIDHRLDVVLVFLVERGGFLDLVQVAVAADSREARFLPLGASSAEGWGGKEGVSEGRSGGAAE